MATVCAADIELIEKIENLTKPRCELPLSARLTAKKSISQCSLIGAWVKWSDARALCRIARKALKERDEAIAKLHATSNLNS